MILKVNILYFDIKEGKKRNTELASQTADKEQYPFDIMLDNIHLLETSPSCFRMVTHYGITQADVESTLVTLKRMVG